MLSTRGRTAALAMIAALVVASAAWAQCVPTWMGTSGVTDTIYASTLWDPDGPGPRTSVIVVGGAFTVPGVPGTNNIATFDPLTGTWAALGSGFPSSAVLTLLVRPNSELIAAGIMGGGYIARWNGSAWVPLGTGLNNQVRALTNYFNGDLIAGGWFTAAGTQGVSHIARWNGSSWSPVGSGVNGNVYALATLPWGDLVVGGSMSNAGGVAVNNVARYSPFEDMWLPLGSGVNGDVNALLTTSTGEVYAGGLFSAAGGAPANRIARWNWSTWSPLGAGITGNYYVWDLAQLSGGDIIAAGNFTVAGTLAANNVARWNGSAWFPIGNNGVNSVAYALTTLPNDELFVGGRFKSAGGIAANSFARYTFTGIPIVSYQPLPQTLYPGESFELVARCGDGYVGVECQWFRNGVPISNGPAGASSGGGSVTGAGYALVSPSTLSLAALRVTGAQPSDSGLYHVVFENACGSVSSESVLVTVIAPCTADINTDGFLTFEDFDAFVASFEAGSAAADFNADGFLTFEDFDAFVSAFEAGC
ncbi:MAG: GC-type dockerin domain-anchored protein [Planctomycetota bacterium]|nr:GC-type dockerin domain-anchored protein [Planctomycetota bacterium]